MGSVIYSIKSKLNNQHTSPHSLKFNLIWFHFEQSWTSFSPSDMGVDLRRASSELGFSGLVQQRQSQVSSRPPLIKGHNLGGFRCLGFYRPCTQI